MNDCPALIKPEMYTWAREKAGKTQAEVDRLLTQPLGWCAKVEAGEREATVDEAKAFAAHCGIGFGSLFLPAPPMEPDPLCFQTALEIVAEWALEGIIDQENLWGGKEGFIQRHGQRNYDALAMIQAFIKDGRVETPDADRWNGLYKHIGEQLARVRHSAGLTQEALAEAAGLTRVSISNIEAGRQRTSVWNLYKLAQACRSNMRNILPSSWEPS